MLVFPIQTNSNISSSFEDASLEGGRNVDQKPKPETKQCMLQKSKRTPSIYKQTLQKYDQ